MEKLRREIGNRLKEIRVRVFAEGVRLSAGQFASLFNSTEDKIRNYETGRSFIPAELLVKLYHKGINPTYLLTGEDGIFARNKAGRILKEKVEGPRHSSGKEVEVLDIDTSLLSEEQKLSLISAVAGDILKTRGKGE